MVKYSTGKSYSIPNPFKKPFSGYLENDEYVPWKFWPNLIWAVSWIILVGIVAIPLTGVLAYFLLTTTLPWWIFSTATVAVGFFLLGCAVIESYKLCCDDKVIWYFLVAVPLGVVPLGLSVWGAYHLAPI